MTSLVRSAPFARAEFAVQQGALNLGLSEDDHMPRDEWEDLGVTIVARGKSAAWQLGDWLLYGEFEYGKTYEEAQALTGLEYQTLADIKYVAGKFSRRRENLDISHHREVAALPSVEREAWLDLAEKHEWSKRELRERLSEQKALERGDDPAGKVVAHIFRVTASPEDETLFGQAAERRGLGVNEWLLEVAREHAQAELAEAA